MPENTRSTDDATRETKNRFPRRLLFATAAAGVAGVAATATLADAAPAEAASATTPWVLGGNSGVTTSNFIGPTTPEIPLIFKTKYTTSSGVSEKMRLSAVGRLGVGVTDPKARVDAIGSTIAVQGTSTATDTTGRALSGVAKGGYGLFAKSASHIGASCEGALYGVFAKGLYGLVAEGVAYGGYFSAENGLYTTGTGLGLYATGATAVYASGSSKSVHGVGGQYAIYGENGGTASVRGVSPYVGVWGDGTTYGLYGRATGTTGATIGVYASCDSPDGYAVYANGNARVTGTLSKSAGSFMIDHPLDPDNRWLSHSFVESPDMMNVYNGNATTDAKGKATVTLPGYFEALNRDLRYQLTVIGGGFAQVMVSRKVKGNTFEIASDKPGIEVSWQVTGIRQDTYAKEHPIVVETDKAGPEKGARFAPGAAPSSASGIVPPPSEPEGAAPTEAPVAPSVKAPSAPLAKGTPTAP